MKLLVSVGSRSDKTCSIGAFARAEAVAMKKIFDDVEILEPTHNDEYPIISGNKYPDVIFFHAPSLHDRKRPWNALKNALILRIKFPRAEFVSVVHEYSEAPLHWKVRQIALVKISSSAITNTASDCADLKKFKKKILRSTLGPTLFFESLIRTHDEKTLDELIKSYRSEMSSKYDLDESKRWILHPGLITPGKGVNTLDRIIPVLEESTVLIVMGGIGPKERDQSFASKVIEELQKKSKHSRVIISPADQDFSKMLLASDLVILPYDVGVSERRSSFLSAMSCGANIWTTSGVYSGELGLDSSGVNIVSSDEWSGMKKSAIDSVIKSLNESKSAQTLRRMKNLEWAAGHGWSKRTEDISKFLQIPIK